MRRQLVPQQHGWPVVDVDQQVRIAIAIQVAGGQATTDHPGLKPGPRLLPLALLGLWALARAAGPVLLILIAASTLTPPAGSVVAGWASRDSSVI